MKIQLIVFIVFLLNATQLSSQSSLPTDYLKPEFHQDRRENLRKKMPSKSVAVFMANPVQNRSNDVDYIFHQDPNLYYLSGYKEPNGLLMVFSEVQQIGDDRVNEILFVQERNPLQEQWNGYRLGVEGARKTLGFTHSMESNKFHQLAIDFSKFEKIFLSLPKGEYTNQENNKDDSYKLLQSLKRKIMERVPKNVSDSESRSILSFPKVDAKGLRILMTELRQIKTPEEIELLRKAAKISAMGQREVMKAMHPNMSETEIQGVHEFVYKKYGSEYEGYPSIVGAGNNGCILHYIENNKTRVGNDLVLMDLGAEYHGYSADVTRTIPATGKFSEAQKIIYELVLIAQKAGIEKARVGSSFKEVDKASREIINKGLLQLGIIKDEKEGRKYFPHGTGHYLGLDVHDLGDYKAFQHNMLITVEPGIYIPKDSDCDPKWHGIAVRIEDDILITNNGPVNLSVDAPKEIAEIEALMKETSVFKNFVLPEIH